MTDVLLPFQMGAGAVRGRLVRLDTALDAVLSGHDYPAPVAQLMGQTLALAAALAGALKYDGIFTLQAQGDGPVSLLLADVTSSGHLRGYARFTDDHLPANTNGDLTALMGKGHLAFTVDQGPNTDRYQGIVELTGPTLADSARQYFQQSEQLDTDVKLACRCGPDGHWQAGALMISRMPADMQGGPILTAEAFDDAWQTSTVLLSTLQVDELLHPTLSADKLVWNLFHQLDVAFHPARPLEARCRCSRDRIASALRTIPRGEIAELADASGHVEITCEFCQTAYKFNHHDLTLVYEP